MLATLQRIWHIKSLRQNILFVLGMLIIFRATAHIPVPGVNIEALRGFLSGNQVLGLLNIFSGGTIKNFSIVMLGVSPYITASIIFQVLTMALPQLEELQKEGESGQRKINTYTRLASIPLAVLQAFALLRLLGSTASQSGGNILGDVSTFQWVAMITAVTAGTIFLMWIGELVTEKNVGNGISILIFSGIVSALPTTIQNIVVNYNPADLPTYILFLAVAVITVVGVVYITEGQRNIPITYARQVRGRAAAGMKNHLPLRLNMAGVIPIIFAVSVVLFPPMIAQFFAAHTGMGGSIARGVITFFNNQLYYGILYFLLVFGFTYFYTAIIFRPEKMAENLQRQGAFIANVRPGKQTEEYLGKVMNRLVFSGALFLALIAVLPLVVQAFTHSSVLAVGGVSLLIVVSVAIEMAKQVEAQLTMHEYDRV
ncbi:MAG: preprotein translocase subunit SecY [Candidatus Magasanikbacteria bacterium CG10_big_fil_rev_8_21_14_0_10_42_10]|uniref:Protein translocase subunit SecY n=2 Tax=Candidatus Magasanikiibacteriota TaxID=1752731 RepID=A0A2H0TXE2_9BACT|nr:MAG: preprotein translocase subunit SecY [Candidatus Magasanikbacteria bacterium CG10_big_fil_rev_8_21_14_0_10_42_10]PIZ94287.1 MAG: preprotein translocase subunit SecY [Candidatus Magasanikbacteria bacterium CG_4_10_14_0_2_um_filter_41_10]